VLLSEWYDFRDLGNPVSALYDALEDAGVSDAAIFVLSALLGCIAILTFIGVTSIINIWVERRVVGRMQSRLGPNRLGPFGLLQPIADAIKLIQKEALTPRLGDGLVFAIAPIAVFIPAILAFAVFPWGSDMVLANLNVGVLYLIALGSTAIIIVFMAGYASNNKYALLGSMRVIAMLISYEIPSLLALLSVVTFVGTMSLAGIADFQAFYHSWLVFFLPLPLAIFLLGATVEINRTPADIAEAESEIIAGYHIEYSGMKFGLFYAVELVNAIGVSAIIAAVFLGGWYTFGLEDFVPGFLLFIGKIYAVYFVLIWFRGTLPRFRVDQLMAFAWKVLLPMALVSVMVVAFEVLLWEENNLNAGVVLPAFAVVNFALTALLVFAFARVMMRQYTRFPTRAVLVGDIDVPPAASSAARGVEVRA
jgi:NADH-quinone oxidoreductase subunit H